MGTRMKFEIFGEKHVEEAVELLIKSTRAECAMVSALPNEDWSEKLRKLLLSMTKHDLGLAYIDQGKLLCFMTGYMPIEGFFGRDKGVFVPVHGHGAVVAHQEKLYALTYQEAARRWTNQGIVSHAFAVYGHNKTLLDYFSWNGFGYRCADAIASVEPLDVARTKGYEFELAIEEDYNKIHGMYIKLREHLYDSPTFYIDEVTISYEMFLAKKAATNSRFLLIKKESTVIGYIEYCDHGENFVTNHETMANICGAYLEEAYRGQGLYSQLLDELFRHLQEKGYTRCGVDYETFNPTARGFWNKYFTPYVISVTRRIDERLIDFLE